MAAFGPTVMLDTEYHEAYREHVGRWGVGATLRGAREAGGEDLFQVANATRIRAEYLNALEEDDYKSLPGWPYAISYVRTYADYLGLESGPLVRHVKEKYALQAHMYGSDAQAGPRGGPRRALQAGLIVLAAVIGGGLYFSAPAESLTAMFEPVPREIKAFIDRSFYTVAEGEQVETAALPVDEQPPAAEAEPVQPETGATMVMATHPRGAIDRDAEDPLQVILRAKSPVWLTVEDAAGGVLIAQQLKRGQLYRIPREVGLVLSADDGSALEYYVEGKLAGVIGDRQQGLSRLPVARLTERVSGG